MSLDDELRSTFEHEALTRPAPPPDPGGLIRGGRVRRRRRTLRRAGAGTAAAVLVGAAGYGLLPGTSDDPIASRPSGTSSSPTVLPDSSGWGRPELDPGTYRSSVGRDASGGRIAADFTVEGDNWSSGDYPLATAQFGSTHAGIGIYQPRALAAGNGCREGPVSSNLGRTPRRLADQLAQLPRSTVLEPPTPARAFEHATVHLQLRIDAQCPSFYRVADSRVGERGITYVNPGVAVEVVIDFWVIDVAGALVVVDQWHDVGASDALVAQAERARESVVLITGE